MADDFQDDWQPVGQQQGANDWQAPADEHDDWQPVSEFHPQVPISSGAEQPVPQAIDQTPSEEPGRRDLLNLPTNVVTGAAKGFAKGFGPLEFGQGEKTPEQEAFEQAHPTASKIIKQALISSGIDPAIELATKTFSGTLGAIEGGVQGFGQSLGLGQSQSESLGREAAAVGEFAPFHTTGIPHPPGGVARVPNLLQTPDVDAAMKAKPPFPGADVNEGPKPGAPANENVAPPVTGEVPLGQKAGQVGGIPPSAEALAPVRERPTTAEVQVPANENIAPATAAVEPRAGRIQQSLFGRYPGEEGEVGPTPNEVARNGVTAPPEDLAAPETVKPSAAEIPPEKVVSENFGGREAVGQNENIPEAVRDLKINRGRGAQPSFEPGEPPVQAMSRKTPGKGPEEILKAIEEGGTLEKLEKAAGVPKKQLTPPNLPDADAKWGEVPTKARNAIEKWFNNSTVGKLFVPEGTHPGEIASHDIRKSRSYRYLDQIDHSLEEAEGVIGKLPEEAQREIQTFIDKTEPGAKINSMPELQKHIDAIRKAHDMTDQLVKDYGTFDLSDFDRNRWPEQFKDPEAAREALDEWRGDTKGRKNQTPPLQEMIEAGHELKTNNPITALRAETQAKFDKLALSRIIQAGKDRGLIKTKIPKDQVEGQNWVPLKAKALNGETLYAPEGYANVFNRNYSPSFYDTQMGRAVMKPIAKLGNWSTALQLGLSPFHASTMLQERAVNQVARALQLEHPGKTAESAFKIFQGRGKDILSEWVNPGTHPELSKFVDKLDDIGAKPLGRNPEFELGMKSNLTATKSAGKMVPDAWNRAIKDFKGAKEELRIASPGQKMLIIPRQTLNGVAEAMHTVTEPLFGVIIPRMKVSSFAENLGTWMEKNPGHTDAQATKAAHEIWKDIESRFGLMNHDNLWMDRRVKEVLTALLTSMSWNYGFLRNAGLALKDVAMHPQRISMKSKDFNPNITSLVGLGMVAAMTGTAVGLYKTGNWPGSPMEAFLPKSGGKDEKGQPTHILTPGFQKDWLSYYLHPLDELVSKQKVLWQSLISLGTNKGWMDTPKGPRYGPIADESKHSLLDYMKEHGIHYLKQQMPISMQVFTRHQAPESNISPIERFFALREAPKKFTLPPNPKTDTYLHNDWLKSHGQKPKYGGVK